MSEKIKKGLMELICCLFILLFVYAATSKIIDFENFKSQIGQSYLLAAFSDWVAMTIPPLEVIIALMFLWQNLRLVALYLSYALMVLFTVYIIAITQFSDHVPCSCGGILQKMNWNQHLLFNIVFVILSIAAVVLYPRNTINSKVKKVEC